ncbi:MAG: hypothetical protein ACK47B_29150 [Armatimonadota bacterium]
MEEPTHAELIEASGESEDHTPEILPEGGNLYHPREPDRIMTSSGEAPTGGIPVGGASDRVIPDRAVREAASATGEPALRHHEEVPHIPAE